MNHYDPNMRSLLDVLERDAQTAIAERNAAALTLARTCRHKLEIAYQRYRDDCKQIILEYESERLKV